MLKYKIAKLEDAPEGAAQFYKAEGDGFVLNVTGEPGSDELKRAKEHEKNLRVAEEAKTAELTTKLSAAEAKVTTVTGERDAAVAAKGQDVQALEASWQAKLDAKEAELGTVSTTLTGEISRLLVTNTAQAVAGEISIVPELFSDIVAKRLVAEKGADGKFFTRVLDAEGKPSALTVDELKKDLLANEKYAAIVIASKGSGSGASKVPGGGGADKKWDEYSDAELIDLKNTDRPKYDRVIAASRAV